MLCPSLPAVLSPQTPPMALNFEALHGAALASCLVTSTCTPERCFMSPGHTTPFHGVSSAPFSAGWPCISLAPISGHWSRVCGLCALQLFPTSLPSAKPRAAGQTLWEHTRRECMGSLCPVCLHLRCEGQQPLASSHQSPWATEGGHCLPGTQAPSVAAETPSPISCGLSCGRCPQHPTLALRSCRIPREHVLIGPHACSGGRQNREEQFLLAHAQD